MKTMTCTPVINRTRFRSHVGDYFAQRFQKEVILLHFPAALSARSICKPWARRRAELSLPRRTKYRKQKTPLAGRFLCRNKNLRFSAGYGPGEREPW